MGEVAIPIMIGASVFEGVSGYEAAEARKQALKEREDQEQAAANEKAIQRTEQLRKIIGAQEAAAGARGYSVTSPSFQAIQANTFNEWAADEKATQLSLDYTKSSLQAEESAAEAQGIGALFGSAANIFQIGMGQGWFDGTSGTGAITGSAAGNAISSTTGGVPGNALQVGNLPGTRNLYKNFKIGL